MDTPPFLLWALEYVCPIRGFEVGRDPERVERQLRAARAVSQARHEGRVFEGLCLDPPLGFHVEDALALYGGLETVASACGACPASAAGFVDPASLAGCFGLVPLPPAEAELHEACEQAIERLGLAADIARLFPTSQPRWYGLWICSPLTESKQELLSRLLAAIKISDAAFRAALAELQLGFQAGIEHRLPLHVAVYPRGRVEDGWWRLASHCPRCKAPKVVGTLRVPFPGDGTRSVPTTTRRCGVCGYEGRPAPDTKRRARGRRPYRMLDRLLGAAQAADFLSRYEAFQKSRASPAPGQNPPPPARPDNPPAD